MPKKSKPKYVSTDLPWNNDVLTEEDLIYAANEIISVNIALQAAHEGTNKSVDELAATAKDLCMPHLERDFPTKPTKVNSLFRKLGKA